MHTHRLAVLARLRDGRARAPNARANRTRESQRGRRRTRPTCIRTRRSPREDRRARAHRTRAPTAPAKSSGADDARAPIPQNASLTTATQQRCHRRHAERDDLAARACPSGRMSASVSRAAIAGARRHPTATKYATLARPRSPRAHTGRARASTTGRASTNAPSPGACSRRTRASTNARVPACTKGARHA